MARSILEEGLVGLAPPQHRPELRAALSADDPSRLPPAARAIFDLLRNRQPGRTTELAAALPDDLRGLLARFSPSSVAGLLEVPVAAMHSTDDPAVPYGELIRLRSALPEARVVTVSSFRHVDPTASSPGGWGALLADSWDAWTFTAWILGVQE